MTESNNYTNDVINEVVRIVIGEALNFGDTLLKAADAGELNTTRGLDLIVPIGNIKPKNFSLLTRATLAAGTSEAGVVGNSIIVSLGVYTGGNSALQYSVTTNKQAKMFYALSALFSTSAVINGGIAVASRTCHISNAAAFSEAIGFACMKLGNKAHLIGLQIEGKPVPPRLRRYFNQNRRPLNSRPDGRLSFLMPGQTSNMTIDYISFKKIGQLVGLGLAVYGYSKVVIVSYLFRLLGITKQMLSLFQELIRNMLF